MNASNECRTTMKFYTIATETIQCPIKYYSERPYHSNVQVRVYETQNNTPYNRLRENANVQSNEPTNYIRKARKPSHYQRKVIGKQKANTCPKW